MGRKPLLQKMMYIGAFIVLLISTLSGCRKDVKTQTTTEEDKIVIGLSLGTLMEDRWIRDRDIFIAMAQQEGFDVIVNNANKDSDIQFQQVKDMINQGIDVLVIAPNDSISEAKCVKAAKDKNIPVVSYDRLVENSNVDVYISFDNYQVGEIMAAYMIENVPEGGYIIVNGSKNDSNSEMINEGAMSILKPYIEKGQIQVVAETWVDGWIRESAYDFVSRQLSTYTEDISAIICGNDSLAWGAIDALSEAQIAEQVKVAGQDADLVACQRIATGKQSLTVYKPIKNLVMKTVEVCAQLIKGEEIQSDKMIYDGTFEVPYIVIGVEAVTKENMDDTVIKDGFHLYDDVYQTENK
jgi:D-xylose transport system substrate-binding protein